MSGLEGAAQPAPSSKGSTMLKRSIAFLIIAISFGCSKAGEKPAAREEPPLIEQPRPQVETTDARPQPERQEAKLDEVLGAIERVYQKAVVPAFGEGRGFLVGDFNGDLSEDLAAVVKPAPEKLAEINDELANWIIQDVQSSIDPIVKLQNPHARPRRPIVGPGDLLLAIIHGYGPGGWRNPEARQTYLLKHAVGKDMTARKRTDALKMARRDKLPELRGDVIAQELGQKRGFIYWTGARYVWWDPSLKKQVEPPKTYPHVRAMQGN